MNEGQLFTWASLSAIGGASLLTFFVVQYTKELVDRYAKRLPTDLYAVLVAFVILLLAQLANGANAGDWRVYVLALANGFLVAAAAGQIQNKALHPPGAKKNSGNGNGGDKSAAGETEGGRGDSGDGNAEKNE
ncbi:hypothetical protein [Cohnella algarum]|uniref:hypothetical protein n=1 Tax=Cohnella algarum TaxID=2044859 RepID=UPI001F07A97C|nr:hypothetical protein [Cohnella algarum]